MYIKRLRLKKLFNTRDLGDIPTGDGKHIVKGKLIRSGKLYKLPEETQQKLKDMGLKTVVDLRIAAEYEDYPDTIIDGVNYIHLPLLCTATTGITLERSMRKTMAVESRRIKSEFGNADNYMIAMYKTIVFSEESTVNLKQVMRLIIDNDDCILWHCSGGKDRAGIVTMLLLYLLGVDEDTIIIDYAASHFFQRKKFFWNRVGLHVAPLYGRFKAILFGMMAAKPEYMTSTIDEIKAHYGTIENYCKQVLDITDADIATLKSKYLEEA
jgi:protein-tyrosine phosphatase